MTFDGLPRGHYGAILADPPWNFETWDNGRGAFVYDSRHALKHYPVMSIPELCGLPVNAIAANDCALFLWATWPMLDRAFKVIEAWGFTYRTCAFCWTKAHAGQLEMFRDDHDVQIGNGFWTRANTEPCLLGARGNAKRLNADVRQAIIAPRREHSRKPDGIHERIERLVAGPYLELFARQRRPGWDAWGNEVDKFTPQQVSRETPPDSWADMWAKPFDFSKEPKGNPG